MFERYSGYFINIELLFEFLSNYEFKFVKIMGRVGCNGIRPCDDAPIRAHGGPSGRGATFLDGCARFGRAYMLCQFNAIQRVLAHVMNNIIR